MALRERGIGEGAALRERGIGECGSWWEGAEWASVSPVLPVYVGARDRCDSE